MIGSRLAEREMAEFSGHLDASIYLKLWSEDAKMQIRKNIELDRYTKALNYTEQVCRMRLSSLQIYA